MNHQQKNTGKWRYSDFWIGVTLFLVMTAVGYTHLRFVGRECSAVQSIELLYGPAVTLACGRGFLCPDLQAHPELRKFLRREIETFSPEGLPKHIQEWPTYVALYHRYLVYTTALFWRLFGISWRSLEPLLALMFGWSAAAVYGIMRLGMRRTLAIGLTTLFMISPAMLIILSELRDFSKAPFILTTILILGRLLTHPCTHRRYIFLSALVGLVMGIGMGFRQDILVYAPLSAVVVFFSRLYDHSKTILYRGLAVLLCMIGFVALSLPMFNAMKGAASADFSLIQGFSIKRLDSLGIVPASYRPVASGADGYIFALINDYAQRREGIEAARFYLDSPITDHFNRAWMRTMIAMFPADLVTRGWSAVLRGLRYADAFPPSFEEPTSLHHYVFEGHRVLGHHFHRWGLLYGLLAFLIVALRSPQSAVVGFVLVGYMWGYIALQCESRHAFHLAFLPLWLIGFIVTAIVDSIQTIRRNGFPERSWWVRAYARGILCLVGCAAVVLIPLFVLRAYQETSVRPLFEAYCQAPKKEIPVVAKKQYGWTLFAIQSSDEEATESDLKALYRFLAAWVNPELWFWHARGRLLMAEFDAVQPLEWIIHKYHSDIALSDFSQLIRFCAQPHDGKRVRYYFPVYELLAPSRQDGFVICRGKFEGVAVPDDVAGSFRGLYEVHVPKSITLLMQYNEWNDSGPKHMYQRINFFPDPLFYYQSEKNATDNINLAEAARRFGKDQLSRFLYRAQLLICRRPTTRLYSANALIQMGALQEALEAARSLPPDTASLSEAQGNLLETIGRLLQVQHDIEGAELAFSAAWRLKPEKERELRFELGKLYESNGNYAQALTVYHDLLVIDPENEAACTNVDLLLNGNVTPEERIAFWRKIVERYPHSLLPRLKLGKALKEAGELEVAAALFAEVHNEYPDHLESTLWFATHSEQTLSIEEINSLLTVVLEKQPTWRNLVAFSIAEAAQRLEEAGNPCKAYNLMELALGFLPQEEWFRLRQAQLAYACGDIRKARELYISLLTGPQAEASVAALQQMMASATATGCNFWRQISAQSQENHHVLQALFATCSSEMKGAVERGNINEAREQILGVCNPQCPCEELQALYYLYQLVDSLDSGILESLKKLMARHPEVTRDTETHAIALAEKMVEIHAETAIGFVQQVLILFPKSVNLWQALATCYSDKNDIAAVITVLTEGIKTIPDSELLLLNLEHYVEHLERPEEKIDLCKKALALAPQSTRLRLRLVQSLLDAGNQRLAAGDGTGAYAFYAEALEWSPEASEALWGLAEAYRLQGKAEEVVDIWKRLITNGDILARRTAYTVNASLDTTQSLAFWESLAQEGSENSLIVAHYALALCRNGDVEKGKTIAKKLFHENNSHPEAMMVLGFIESLSGNLETGLEKLNQFLLVSPEAATEVARYLYEFAMRKSQEGEYSCAEKMLRTACRHDPENLLYVMSLGESLLVQNQARESIPYFMHVLREAPESPRTASLLDKAFEELEDEAGRRQAWQAILDLHPDAILPKRQLQTAMPADTPKAH